MVVFGGVVVVGRLEPVRGGAGIFRGLDRRRLDIVVVADVIRRLGLERGLLGQQRLAVGDGDAVVVGMDFAERQEAMAIAAVFDEGRLQRRFEPRYLGEVDVTRTEECRAGKECESTCRYRWTRYH